MFAIESLLLNKALFHPLQKPTIKNLTTCEQDVFATAL
jgi:hypothetical protein